MTWLVRDSHGHIASLRREADGSVQASVGANIATDKRTVGAYHYGEDAESS